MANRKTHSDMIFSGSARFIPVLWALALMISFGLTAGSVQAQSMLPAETAPETSSNTLDLLIEVLKDDAARSALISELESAAASGSADAAPATGPEPETPSLGSRLALVTQTFGQGLATTLGGIWSDLSSGRTVFSGLSGGEVSILLKALPDLLIVIVITVAVFLGLRGLTKRYRSRLRLRAESSGLMQAAGLILAMTVVDLVVVLVSWIIGYGVTLAVVGDFNSIGMSQSLYLNAFLIVQSTKVMIRALLSPASGALRIVTMTDRAARIVNRALGLVIGVLGYGQLLVVPIVNQNASPAAGAGISALLSVLVLVFLIYTVLRHRQGVAEWLSPAQAPQSETGPDGEITPRGPGWASGLIAAFARQWHWLALVYLGLMFIVVMTQPDSVALVAMNASAKVLAALVAASLVTSWLAAATARGIALPHDITQRLPLLEPRLNRFVPRAFGAVRLAVSLFVMLFILDVINMIDMTAVLESQFGIQMTTSLVSVAMILLVAFLIWLAMTSFVDYRLNPEYGAVPTSRETTLLTLLRNAATIAIVIITLMFSLSEIGINIGPLLASAGVLGLAIGFGAQSMVKDIITGIFIQFENAINVGDVITVGGITGAVEKLSVRSVSLRDGQGVFHIIPFSSVDMVSNAMRDFSYAVCDMGIAYRENVDEAKQAMLDAFDLLAKEEEYEDAILAPLEWLGVTGFGDNAVMLRARIKTAPGRQWAVGRAYNGHLKTVFDDRKIEIPFPQQTIWLGEAKDGTTQRFQIAGPGGGAGAKSKG